MNRPIRLMYYIWTLGLRTIWYIWRLEKLCKNPKDYHFIIQTQDPCLSNSLPISFAMRQCCQRSYVYSKNSYIPGNTFLWQQTSVVSNLFTAKLERSYTLNLWQTLQVIGHIWLRSAHCRVLHLRADPGRHYVQLLQRMSCHVLTMVYLQQFTCNTLCQIFKWFSLLFLKFHKLSDDSSYNIMRWLFLDAIPSYSLQVYHCRCTISSTGYVRHCKSYNCC